MYPYDIDIKLFRIVSEKRLKQKSGLPRAQSREGTFYYSSPQMKCIYFYDINIKLFRIV